MMAGPSRVDSPCPSFSRRADPPDHPGLGSPEDAGRKSPTSLHTMAGEYRRGALSGMYHFVRRGRLARGGSIQMTATGCGHATQCRVSASTGRPTAPAAAHSLPCTTPGSVSILPPMRSPHCALWPSHGVDTPPGQSAPRPCRRSGDIPTTEQPRSAPHALLPVWRPSRCPVAPPQGCAAKPSTPLSRPIRQPSQRRWAPSDCRSPRPPPRPLGGQLYALPRRNLPYR